MFDALPGFWTPVIPARQLKAKPLPLWLAGERVVLFRGKDGPAALIDQCPHRGVALSLGKVRDGCLECPFHGWQFKGDGSCEHVPLNPNAKRERLGATALPTRELAGMIWVFTGTATNEEPIAPEALLRPHVRKAWFYEVWDTHWTRAMENMLDVPHLPYVHRKTIGRGMRKYLSPESTVFQDLKPTDRGFELQFGMKGEAPARLDWVRPNGMELHILDSDKRLMRMHVWCVPEKENRTGMLIATSQYFGFFTPLARLGDFFNYKILAEDRSIVESSTPREVPEAGDEKSVATDMATLHFRTWYRRTFTRRDGDSNGSVVPMRSLMKKTASGNS